MGFPAPGGSCLISCRIDEKDSSGNIVPHGYIREFDQYHELIRQQLQQMFDSGQRRLGICVAYYEGGDTFALDAKDGTLKPQDGQNLTALLQLAVSIGFVEFLIEMIPEWTASYQNWQNSGVMGQGNVRSWEPLEYDTILRFTFGVDACIARAIPGNPYHMDLLAECDNEELAGRLWMDWCAQKDGPASSLGFSMIPTQRAIAQIPKFYRNGILPPAWNVHAYNGPTELTWSQFKAAMKQAGHYEGFVVGETNCNDPATAQSFRQDSSDLFWILQWPVVSGVTPAGVTQDRLTLEYSAYQRAGL